MGWNGTINVPTVKANSTVTATPDSGKTATVNSVIEIGYGDVKLVFSNAVRILIPGQAGKDVGYSRSGVFTKITNTCSADTQDVGNALAAEGDCKINASNGLDLVIWTKHFTSFATYTQTTNSSSGGGGGGGVPITNPPTNTSIVIAGGAATTNTVNVSLTLAATNAIQMAISNSSDFTGGIFETYAISKSWTLLPGDGVKTVYAKFRSSAGGVSSVVSDTITLQSGGQVLGATVSNVHADGTLILDNGTIYLVKDGKRQGFRTSEEYFSQGYSFSQAVPASASDLALPAGNVVKALEGTLVLDKTDNRTVYMIGQNGTKRGFTTAEVFIALGYSFANLPVIDLTDYTAGPVIDSATAVHPDGALVLNQGTVWWVKGSERQGFQSEAVFKTYGFSFAKVVSANAEDMALTQGVLVKFRDGTLVNDNGTIYVISDGKKLGLKSMNALTTRGYNLKNAIQASLQSYEAGASLD
jgi:hypothetical protein